MLGPVSASLRLYVAVCLASLVAAAGAVVLFSVGGALGLLALFALVVALFVALGAVVVTR